MESPPLILFSGLAADASVFKPQKIAFPQLVVPEWPVPQPEDTLASYCDRLADELKEQGDVVIGGASFGGIIALHVAQRLKPRGVILIGSVQSPEELSRLAKISRPLKRLIPWIPVRVLQFCSAPFSSNLARWMMPQKSGFVRQFRSSNPIVFKWSLRQILEWDSVPEVSCPVFQIHGERDRILPIRFTHPDAIVNRGGHVITITHPSEVNEFLRTCIGELEGSTSDAD